MSRTSSAILLALVLPLPSSGAAGQSAPTSPPPPCPHVARSRTSEGLESSERGAFRTGQPIVGTYYFYWYDDETDAHFVDPDGSDALTRHPETRDGYSFRDPDWHERELMDMRAARIDFLLPVYWGSPGDGASWSVEGLPPLVEAARRSRDRGDAPPRIGCFYDTSTLRHNPRGYHADLRTARGKEWLYATVRDFYSLVPHDLRATIDGRPMVWLYTAAFAKAQDPAALDHLRGRFERDFGVEPFIVKEVSWEGRADATYAWGAALAPRIHDVAAVGPGYDHAAVPGRSPLVRERDGGRFYRRSWEALLRMPRASRPAIAVVETWNEWHEGTDIAPSAESGRLYVELTREYANRWHRGVVHRPLVEGATSGEVSITLGAENEPRGVEQSEEPDGVTAARAARGREGRGTVETRHAGRYIYFDVDDAFYFASGAPLEVEVEYLDVPGAPLLLEYDSTDRSAPHGGAFRAAPEVPRRRTGEWRSVAVELRDAAFVGRANGNDFRLVDRDGSLVVHRVSVRKVASAAAEEEPVSGRRARPTVLVRDGAWCWFQDERAIVANGRLIVGSVAHGRGDASRLGSIEVTSCELATGVVRRAPLHRRLERDDHAAPAFLERPDGHLLAVYSKHGSDGAIRVRVSERPGDATTWGEERRIVPSESSRVTYSNVFLLRAEGGAAGRIHDFFRGYDDSFEPSWMTSDDGGRTWAARGVLISSGTGARHRPYVKYASDGEDEVHFAFTEGHPRAYDNSVYHALYRDGALWRTDGVRIAAASQIPITPEQSTRVFEGGPDDVAWTSDLHLDAADRPVVVYSVQRGAAGVRPGDPRGGRDHRYRYARWDGERWRDAQVAYAGTRLYRGEDDYTGNICLDPGDVDTVYFSTNVDPRTGAANASGRWELWRGRTADLGATWDFALVASDAGEDHLRPIVPIDPEGRTLLLWLRGRYHSYRSWNLDVVVEPQPPRR